MITNKTVNPNSFLLSVKFKLNLYHVQYCEMYLQQTEFPKGLFSSLNIKNFVSIVALTSLISFEVSDDTDIKLASINCNVLLMKFISNYFFAFYM